MGVARAIMEARPPVIAALAVQLRDLDLAEEAFSEAAARCLERSEAPRNLAGWLFVVAKRKALDLMRRRAAEARALDDPARVGSGDEFDMADILEMPDPIGDERLRLIFICCHPALALDARCALALKVICGLGVPDIARLFVTGEPTMYQRITRAKRRVAEAGIAFELPPRKHWGERLDAVLLTLELAYTAAYQDAAGERDAELSGEVARLAAMVAELLPQEPEALGLAALVWLARSREAARVDDDGAMVPLSQQDPARWDREAIEQARRWLDAAALLGTSGPYQVMAAIQLTHARRAYDGKTDWGAILNLYEVLQQMRPGAITSLNRAVALAKVHGAEAGLRELDEVDGAGLANARPFHAARADLLSAVGRYEEARDAFDAALALDPPRAERLFLMRRREALPLR